MLKPTAILLLAILISFNSPHILQAQDKKDAKDQTIRLKSELVQVRAVVTDSRKKTSSFSKTLVLKISVSFQSKRSTVRLRAR